MLGVELTYFQWRLLSGISIPMTPPTPQQHLAVVVVVLVYARRAVAKVMIGGDETDGGWDVGERVAEREVERRRKLGGILSENDRGQMRLHDESEEEEEHDEEDDDEELAQFEDDTDSFMLRKREFLFAGLPPVALSQDFVSVEGTGGAVWRPSVQFGKFVCGPKGRRSLPLAGKSVLEISSGLGLGAIVAWHLGASPVVATDIASENGPIALLSRNVTANCGGTAAFSASLAGAEGGLVVAATHGDKFDWESGVIEQGKRETHSRPPYVQELCWGNGAQLADTLVRFKGFGPDVVLACDVIFDDALLAPLSETLVEACGLRTKEGTRPSLCISHQRRNKKREDRFFCDLARQLGGGEWREVHREDDLSVFLMVW